MKGLVEAAHGKICQDDNNSVTYRKKDGKMFSMRRCNDRNLETKPYTDKELRIHSSFGQTSKIAAAWTQKNRVYKQNSRIIDLNGSTEEYRKMRTAFDAQNKIPTFQAFVWSCIKDGVVVVPATSPNPSQGGGNGNTQNPSGSVKHTLTLSADPSIGGSVDGAGEYRNGEVANISATPASGYKFLRWSDGNTSVSRTVTMTEDKVLTAQFQVDSESGDNSGW